MGLSLLYEPIYAKCKKELALAEEALASTAWTENNLEVSIRAIVSSRKKIPLSRKALMAYSGKDLASITRQTTGKPRTGAGLVLAAAKMFGSWDAALEAAGIEPKSVRRDAASQLTRTELVAILNVLDGKLPLCRNCIARSQEVEKIIEAMMGYKISGRMLTQYAVEEFGSWNNFLKAGGLDPRDVYEVKRVWTVTNIKKIIKRLHQAGIPLNSGNIQFDNSDLVQGIIFEVSGKRNSGRNFHAAAQRIFGSWDEALRSSGLDPNQIRRRFWSHYRLSFFKSENRAQRQLGRFEVGRIELTAEDAFARNEVWGAYKKGLSSLSVEDQEVMTRVLDIVLASSQVLSAEEIAVRLSEEFAGPVDVFTVRRLLGLMEKQFLAWGP